MRPFRSLPPTAAVAIVIVIAVVGVASTARAQDGRAMCTGMLAPQFTYALSQQRFEDDTNYKIIAPNVTRNVLNLAECTCAAQLDAIPNADGSIPGMDLFLRGMVTQAIPNNQSPEFHVFAGTACNVSTNQTTTCDDLANFQVSGDKFRLGQSVPVQAVPVRSLANPGSMANAHTCMEQNATNSLWFLFGPLSGPDYCQVQIDYHGQPPDAARNVRAGAGDEAVSISWDAPKAGTAHPPDHYQVLCSDVSGNPVGSGAYAFGEVPGDRKRLSYTTCVDPGSHTVQRQVLSTTSPTSNADGGVLDAGTAVVGEPGPGESAAVGSNGDDVPSTRDEPLGTEADPVDGGEASTCETPDLGMPAAFTRLDKKYVCSDVLGSTATSVRITGLKNNESYFFTVVAVDLYGNATPSSPICAKPQPVEDLWRRCLSEGCKQQGFCFIATAAYGSYQSPFVMVLRDFRDRVLLPTESGAAFVAWYYRVSPPIADWIRPRPWARFAVRVALWPVIVAAGLWMWLETAEWVALALLLFALVYVRRARLRARAASARTAAPVAATLGDAPLAPAGSEA